MFDTAGSIAFRRVERLARGTGATQSLGEMPWKSTGRLRYGPMDVTLQQSCDDINTYLHASVATMSFESLLESRSFRALLLSLPTHNSTLRMRLWRALKATGCAV